MNTSSTIIFAIYRITRKEVLLLNLNIDQLRHMCIYFEPLQSVKAQEEYKRLVMQLERFTEPLYANRTHSKRRLNDNITDEEKITKILNKLEQMGTIAEAYKNYC